MRKILVLAALACAAAFPAMAQAIHVSGDHYSITTPMATQHFGRWDDHSVMISNNPGLDAIALQPVGADARCRNVTASFDDGTSDSMPVNGGMTMREGNIYRVHVDGAAHGLDAIGLTCEAENGDAVAIRVFGIG
jgi:hypothetical protein